MEQRTRQIKKPFSKGVHITLQHNQLRDLQNEKEVGNWLFVLGSDLKFMKIGDVLYQLEELDAYLSKVVHSNWKILSWALKPSMLALIQRKFMEHPCKEVRLVVTSYLFEIIRIVAHVPPTTTF